MSFFIILILHKIELCKYSILMLYDGILQKS